MAYSSDEGVAVVQAQMLRSGEGWHYRYPLAGIDREDQARPFVRGDLGTKGMSPYAKHPLYPIVLAGFDLVGGTGGSRRRGAGTLLAALFAALHRPTARPPVTIESSSGWSAWPAPCSSTPTSCWPTMAAAAAAAGDPVGRVGDGPGATCRLAGWPHGRRRLVPHRRVDAAHRGAVRRSRAGRGLRVLVAAPAGCGCAGPRRWPSSVRCQRGRLAGRPRRGPADHRHARPGVPNAAPASWIAGRWDALHTTWLQASYAGGRTGDFALEPGAVLLVGAALLLHRRDSRRSWIVVAVVFAAGCYIVRLVVGPAGSVPGLALAFPAGWFLLWAAGRKVADGVAAPIMAVVAAVVTIAVLVTEYAIGGGVEWGGRYFAIVIPIAVPVLAYAAAPVITRHGAELGRIVVGALVVASLAATLTAAQALRTGHVDTAAVLDAIAVQARAAGTSGGSTVRWW